MKIDDLVRPNIKKLKPYTSARDQYLKGILMDANENPFGSAVDNYVELELNRYPDPNQNALRSKLGAYLRVNPKNLFAGVGSDEIIDLLLRIFCEPGKDKAAVLEPTYGMYRVACDINNIAVQSILLNDDFQIDVRKTLNSIDEDTKIIFICSPNNPTGNLIDEKDILDIASQFDGLVVVDQAYIDFANQAEMLDKINEHKNIILLRTFSKAWGLAGIRLGFAIANEEVIDYLFKVKAPYNVNKITSQIVIDAIENSAKKDVMVQTIISERERIVNELKRISKIDKVFKSDTNYILFRCNQHKMLFEELIKRNIIIRDRSTQPKLENCLRVSVGTNEENNIFLQALNEIL